MRTFAPVLCLALLLVALAPAPAHAGDDDARLARRVEMLLDLVAELKAEVTELKDRVARLEAELESRDEAAGTDPLPPFMTDKPYPAEHPAEDDPAPAPDVSGNYVMDKEASVQAVLENMTEGANEDEMVEIRLMVETQFESVNMELVLTKAGIFEASMKAPPSDEESVKAPPSDEEEESERHSARGTWERTTERTKDGSVRLVLHTTHEDGEKTEKGDRIEGIWRPDGSLRLQQPDDDFVLIFSRK